MVLLLRPEMSPLTTGIPSITYSGVAEALMEPMPRMRMLGTEPGWPEPLVDCTPARLPCRLSCTEALGAFSMTVFLMVVADPVKVLRFWLP